MAEQVAVVEDALVIGGWRVERINEDGECRVAVFSGPGAGEDARFFAVTYGYGDDLRAELAATQQALGETAAALEANLQRCNCGQIATWQWGDYDGEEFKCDEHKDDHFFTDGPDELYEQRDGIAILANPIVQAALDAFRAKEGR